MKNKHIVLLFVLSSFISADGIVPTTGITNSVDDVSKGNINQITNKNQEDRVNDFGFDQQCPNAEDIAPCLCYNYNGIEMDLDCSIVDSEEQLKRIFESDFPSKNFNSFYLLDNYNLKVLEANIFGGISFKTIMICSCAIEVIEPDALDGCYDTLTDLDISLNRLSSFPFNDINLFSQLNKFDISSNFLSTFPGNAFQGLKNLEKIIAEVTSSGNSSAITGNFQNIPKLQMIDLRDNYVSNITANFFKTGSDSLSYIYLYGCQIESIEPDSFDIIDGLTISLSMNLLTTLDEATWRPLFEGGVKIEADYNPLSCGCDVAWLFGEDNLLGQVNTATTCNDGKYLHDLNPAIFVPC